MDIPLALNLMPYQEFISFFPKHFSSHIYAVTLVLSFLIATTFHSQLAGGIINRYLKETHF
jgi:hypothetical protein